MELASKCDRCGKVGVMLSGFPFRYMNASDPRADGDGYFVPVGCEECIDWENRLAMAKRLRRWGFKPFPLGPLLPFLRFKQGETHEQRERIRHREYVRRSIR